MKSIERPDLSAKMAAKYLGKHPRTLRRWRGIGDGPSFTRIGASIRYSIAELDRYIQAQTMAPTPRQYSKAATILGGES